MMQFKKDIELEDFEKQKSWFEERTMAKRKQKKDQERETSIMRFSLLTLFC